MKNTDWAALAGFFSDGEWVFPVGTLRSDDPCVRQMTKDPATGTNTFACKAAIAYAAWSGRLRCR